MGNLDEDFRTFKNSPAAKTPVFNVSDSWRKEMYDAALINGDLAADMNPDKSFDTGYSEPEYSDPEEEFEEEERGSW